ncbi:hypothetical protein [Alicyclobacillus pomorum]|uniref:hypothetical protein n=1 Tax=Alicyclobacillus pomorum TaxID=204470 RepID=UPI0004169D01|nr:hypothetical protein [Alicyclobacillus pomorum]
MTAMQAKYLDPFSVWKSFYGEVEPKLSEAMQKWLESEEYAAFSGQLLSATLQVEQSILKNVEHMLQAYNIPTVKDFARLGELIVGVESKIDQLDERLARLEQLALSNADVREQLEAITAQLESIGQLQLPEASDSDKNATATKNRRRGQRAQEGADESKSELV